MSSPSPILLKVNEIKLLGLSSLALAVYLIWSIIGFQSGMNNICSHLPRSSVTQQWAQSVRVQKHGNGRGYFCDSEDAGFQAGDLGKAITHASCHSCVQKFQ